MFVLKKTYNLTKNELKDATDEIKKLNRILDKFHEKTGVGLTLLNVETVARAVAMVLNRHEEELPVRKLFYKPDSVQIYPVSVLSNSQQDEIFRN